MEELLKQLTISQIAGFIGIPSLAVIFRWIYKKLKDGDKKTESVQHGVQALLRAQMIGEYNKWQERNYAPIYAKESFENMYTQYHNLGANGVMSDIYKKFMALPTHIK